MRGDSVHTGDAFRIQAPTGRFQLLNVHFDTIREGVDALRASGWHGLARFDSNRRSAARESQRVREQSRPCAIR